MRGYSTRVEDEYNDVRINNDGYSMGPLIYNNGVTWNSPERPPLTIQASGSLFIN